MSIAGVELVEYTCTPSAMLTLICLGLLYSDVNPKLFNSVPMLKFAVLEVTSISTLS